MNEELYENIKESLINGLKEQADIEVINIDFDNIEIIVHKIERLILLKLSACSSKIRFGDFTLHKFSFRILLQKLFSSSMIIKYLV